MATRITVSGWLGLTWMALFAGVLLIGGAEGMWFAATHEHTLARVLRYEPSTRVISEGAVRPQTTSGNVEHAMTRTIPVLAPVLRFETDGRSIEFTAPGLSMVQPYPLGSYVPVRFRRKHPEDAILADQDWGIGGAVIQLLTGSLVALLVHSAYRLLQGHPPALLRSRIGPDAARNQ